MSERFYRAFNQELPAHIEDLVLEIESRSKQLSAMLADADQYDQQSLDSYSTAFVTRFTCNSAAIEGSTLSELETQLVLEGEFVPSDQKAVSDMFAVRGVAEGYNYALRQASAGREFSEEFIQDIHERTALDCQPSARGTYRRVSVMIAGSPVTPAPPDQVPTLMGDLVFAYDQSHLPQLAKATVFHVLFEQIHPFIDGNGRTGRTLLNVMLHSASLPAVALKNADRIHYLDTLQQAQLNDDYVPLMKFVGNEILNEISIQRTMLEQTRACTRPQTAGDVAQAISAKVKSSQPDPSRPRTQHHRR